MKKSLILATSFAMALGVGVAVGAHHMKEVAKKAEATGPTLYCTMTYDWWTKDNAAIGIYAWNEGGSPNAAWPGVRMSPVAGETGMWSYPLGESYEKVIFTRVNGSGAISDWGAQTGNLDIPTDGKNHFTISNSSETWGGNPGCTGTWSTYTPVVPSTTYSVTVHLDNKGTPSTTPSVVVAEGALPADPALVYGDAEFEGWFTADDYKTKVTEITADCDVYGRVVAQPTVTYGYDVSKVSSDYENVYLYAFQSGDRKNHDWPGVKLTESTFEVPTDATIILNGGEGKAQTVDVEQLETPVANDVLEVLSSKTGDNYNARWASTVDEPAEDGYYLLGSKTSYKYAGAPKIPELAEPDKDNNVAILEQYDAKAGEKYKVKFFKESTGENTWSSTQAVEGLGTLDEDGNFVMSKDALINIYVKWEKVSEDPEVWALKFYVSEYHEPEPADVPAEDGYYLLGSKTSYKYAGAPKIPELAEPDEDDNVAILEEYEAKEGEKYKVKYYNESEGKDQWSSTIAVEGLGTLDEDGNFVMSKDAFINIYVKWESGALKFYVAEYHEPVAPDVPAADGYYLLGSKTDYKYAGAPEVPELAEPDEDNNVAILLDYDAKEGEKYKVKYYNESEGKNDWGSTIAVEGLGTLDEDGNFVMSKDAHIDIFVKWEKVSEEPEVWAMKFYIAEHAERYNVTFKGLFYEGKDLEKTINVVDTQRATENVNFEVNEERLAQSGYVLRGVYTDNTFEHEYTATKLAAATELFVKYTKSGYYMTGDETFLGEGHGWNVDYSEMIEEHNVGNRFEGTITVPAGVDADHPMLVKPLHYEGQDNEGKTVWASAYYEMGINPSTEQKWEYSFVSVDESGNFKFVKPGTYAFYVYDTNKVTFNSGEYAFHAAFLSQVGGECKNDGSTDLEALKVVWGNMKTAYNALDEADRLEIYNTGFDGGDEESSNDRLRMIAKYNYIVTKYGTAEFEDFIWGQTVTPKVGNNVMFLNNSNNTGLIIIISVSAISVISIAAFLMLKKRKEKQLVKLTELLGLLSYAKQLF